MTLEELVAQVNRAQSLTKLSRRPAVLIGIPEVAKGKLFQLEFGDVKLVGHIVGTKWIRGRPVTAVRFWCDEVMKALEKAGLCEVNQPITGADV